jgi:hypothetical protein
MTKKINSQSLLNSVRKLDKINNIDIEFDGIIEEILDDPISWGERQIERFILENENKYLESKKLGKDFWDEIKDGS